MLFFHYDDEEWTERFNTDDLYPLLNNLTAKGYLEKHRTRRPTHPNLEGIADEEDGFYMHPVMAEVVREKEKPDLKVCGEIVGYVIDQYWPSDGSKNPALAFPWLPYGGLLVNRLPKHERTGTLANNLMTIYYAQGDLKAALIWQLKATTIWEKILPEGHPYHATSFNNLSQIYQAQGDLPAALEWQQKAIVIREKALP